MSELQERAVAYDGLGMQPGRVEASPIKPNKLASRSARTRWSSVLLSSSVRSRIVTVAVRRGEMPKGGRASGETLLGVP
jgi:hypothetical protein